MPGLSQVVLIQPRPSPCTDVASAADLINTAARPILYIGGGVIHAGAASLARRLAEKAGIPTTMTLMGLGAVPTDHPRAHRHAGHACGTLYQYGAWKPATS